jgi:hypothetical protein
MDRNKLSDFGGFVVKTQKMNCWKMNLLFKKKTLPVEILVVLEYNSQKPFPQQNGFGVQLTETISFLLLQLCQSKTE